MKTRPGKAIHRGERGTAAIEFGIGISFLALLVTGIVEVGYSMYQATQVTYAAEAGLFYAAQNGWNASGIQNAATSATGLSGMTATAAQSCGCPSASGITTVSCSATCTSGDNPGQYININVSMTRITIVGSSAFGLPSTVSAQAILRLN